MKKAVFIIGILILLGICGAGQLAFENQKREDAKFDTVARIADKEADALNAQAQALQEQAHAIAVQAETNGKAVDRIVEQSEVIENQAVATTQIFGALAVLLGVVVLVLFIVLRRAPVG